MRTDRTFHKRVSVAAWCGIALFSLLAFYFFITKVAVVGLLLAIVVVGMIERSLHTTYTLHRVKPIDTEEEMDFLSIDGGRFARKRHIALKDIQKVTPMKVNFGLDHYLLITYGPGEQMESVQPANEQAFLDELRKRIRNEE